MSTIRERANEYAKDRAANRTTYCDQDRAALLLAGDAMARAAEDHRFDLSVVDGDRWCGICANQWPCPTRQAADEWREVTG